MKSNIPVLDYYIHFSIEIVKTGLYTKSDMSDVYLVHLPLSRVTVLAPCFPGFISATLIIQY